MPHQLSVQEVSVACDSRIEGCAGNGLRRDGSSFEPRGSDKKVYNVRLYLRCQARFTAAKTRARAGKTAWTWVFRPAGALGSHDRHHCLQHGLRCNCLDAADPRYEGDVAPDREYRIWLPRIAVERLMALREAGETFSDVIRRMT
jgi:hypothetical protein